MLGPKHTAREAAAILVAGLRDGSIVLHHEHQDAPQPDLSEYRLREDNVKLDPYFTSEQSSSQNPTKKKTA